MHALLFAICELRWPATVQCIAIRCDVIINTDMHFYVCMYVMFAYTVYNLGTFSIAIV